MAGGGGGSSSPTVQQQQLQTQQALTTANLNLEENQQRKTILNSMQGTRVFRGSALSRALRGDTNQPGAPSAAQIGATNAVPALISPASLLSGRNSTAQNPSASPTAATRFTGGSGIGGGSNSRGSKF